MVNKILEINLKKKAQKTQQQQQQQQQQHTLNIVRVPCHVICYNRWRPHMGRRHHIR